MNANLDSQTPLIPSLGTGFGKMAADFGKKVEKAWVKLKHKISIAVIRIHDSAASQPVTENAIQSLLGKSKNFKFLIKNIVNPLVKPEGALKVKCKEVVDKLFKNIDLTGLSAKTVIHLHKLIKYSMYNLACKGGEEALPKTAEGVVNIWKNLDVCCVCADRQKVVDELYIRATAVDAIHSTTNEEIFKAAVDEISDLVADDTLGMGIAITRFQHDVEELRSPKNPMSDARIAKKIKQLAKKVPLELPKELHAAVIRMTGEYMRNMSPKVQQEQVFNIQSTLYDAAKVALLLAVDKGDEVSCNAINTEFKALAKPKLLEVIKGDKVRLRPSINCRLHQAAKAAGLKSLSAPRVFFNFLMGRESPVEVPIGHGKIKYYDAASARALSIRHAIVTGNADAGFDILEKREAALKEMLKDVALTRFIKQLVPDRVDHMMNFKYKNIVMTEEEKRVLRRMLEEDLTRELHDLYETSERLNPGYLEIYAEYGDILRNLMNSYSPEAIRRFPAKYERFMDFLAASEGKHASPVYVEITSGSCASILHGLTSFLK